jgi:hypothetical protein
MTLNTRVSTDGRDVQLNAFALLFNNGYLRFYDSTGGTGQPATPNTAIGSQVLLAELRWNATAFGAAGAGSGTDRVITANAITDDSSADATGTATWFRALKSDGTTVEMDGSVGVGSTFNINMNSAAIQSGARVSVTGYTHTFPMQGA